MAITGGVRSGKKYPDTKQNFRFRIKTAAAQASLPDLCQEKAPITTGLKSATPLKKQTCALPLRSGVRNAQRMRAKMEREREREREPAGGLGKGSEKGDGGCILGGP